MERLNRYIENRISEGLNGYAIRFLKDLLDLHDGEYLARLDETYTPMKPVLHYMTGLNAAEIMTGLDAAEIVVRELEILNGSGSVSLWQLKKAIAQGHFTDEKFGKLSGKRALDFISKHIAYTDGGFGVRRTWFP